MGEAPGNADVVLGATVYICDARSTCKGGLVIIKINILSIHTHIYTYIFAI